MRVIFSSFSFFCGDLQVEEAGEDLQVGVEAMR